MLNFKCNKCGSEVEKAATAITETRNESIQSIDFFRSSDTHKTFQSLEVLLYGTVKEMLYLYVKESGESSHSVHVFFAWSPDETFHMLLQRILNFAFTVLIRSVTEPISQSIKALKGIKLLFFYAFDHPLYQEIKHKDLRQKVIMPEGVRSNASRTSLTRSHHNTQRFKVYQILGHDTTWTVSFCFSVASQKIDIKEYKKLCTLLYLFFLQSFPTQSKKATSVSRFYMFKCSSYPSTYRN